MRLVARTCKCRKDLLHVFAVARFDNDVEIGHGHRHVVVKALVVDLDDIAATATDKARHAGEYARLVADLDANAREPSCAREPAHQDRGEHALVDVAAGYHEADLA